MAAQIDQPVGAQQVARLNKKFRFQWEPAQECHVLLYPEGMIQLNQAAGEILQRCQNNLSIQDIIDDLSTAFPDADTLASDVLDFLSEASAAGWVELD